jgi:ribonuclease HII
MLKNIKRLHIMATSHIKSDMHSTYFEDHAWAYNKTLCGIDEVGRGCLAGPVVCAAVILHPHAYHKDLKDSKKLSEKKRNNVYKWLEKNSFYAVSFTDNRTIDHINIYQATLKAMNHAFMNISHTIGSYPDIAVVDAMPLTIERADTDIYYFNKGEDKSCSIAAASIIAKVTRDHLMKRLSNTYTQYGFESHKGYGTARHVDALNQHKHTIIHRVRFLKNFVL